jgi:predicted metal-dependent enzyme (double-stranded beta helix superfamily)
MITGCPASTSTWKRVEREHGPAKYPHARRVYEEGRTLHVVTDLMHKSDSPGFDRKRHNEMMDAIVGVAVATSDRQVYRYDSCVIHSPDQP